MSVNLSAVARLDNRMTKLKIADIVRLTNRAVVTKMSPEAAHLYIYI